jgi:hypothetical protein
MVREATNRFARRITRACRGSCELRHYTSGGALLQTFHVGPRTNEILKERDAQVRMSVEMAGLRSHTS